jgi:hypothetical protein
MKEMPSQNNVACPRCHSRQPPFNSERTTDQTLRIATTALSSDIAFQTTPIKIASPGASKECNALPDSKSVLDRYFGLHSLSYDQIRISDSWQSVLTGRFLKIDRWHSNFHLEVTS